MNDVVTLTADLKRDTDGIWTSDRATAISHPDEYQQWYLAVEDTSYWFQHRADCVVACLNLFAPAGPVLDIGGGNGHVSLAMKRAGFEVILLEPSAEGVKNARHRGIEPVLCTTLEDSGLKKHCVAAAGLFDVLEHVADDAGFLRRIHTILRANGLLYLTVPAFEFLWSRHDDRVGHFRRYSLRGLIPLLEACGFSVEFCSYLFAPLVMPIFLLRSLPTRLRLVPRDELKQFKREHSAEGGAVDRAMRRLLSLEKCAIAKRKSIPMGSSCLVVARAKDATA
jgi:SAM-dependent methyltransferase